MKKETAIDKSRVAFIKKIIQHCLRIKKLKPREMLIFNIIARHGSYQVTVGPEYSPAERKKLHLKEHSRQIGINATMHHLFLNPQGISPTPWHEDLKSNLKGSVIIKDIMIHVIDHNGTKLSVQIEKYERNGIKARKRINLAGNMGEKMVHDLASSPELAKDTYKIIQADILKTIKSA